LARTRVTLTARRALRLFEAWQDVELMEIRAQTASADQLDFN
jgi:hypothetical protein